MLAPCLRLCLMRLARSNEKCARLTTASGWQGAWCRPDDAHYRRLRKRALRVADIVDGPIRNFYVEDFAEGRRGVESLHSRIRHLKILLLAHRLAVRQIRILGIDAYAVMELSSIAENSHKLWVLPGQPQPYPGDVTELDNVPWPLAGRIGLADYRIYRYRYRQDDDDDAYTFRNPQKARRLTAREDAQWCYSITMRVDQR